MAEKTYYLYRHGVTQQSKRGWYGPLSYYRAHILPEARPSLERIGNFLHILSPDKQVSSPLRRCRESAAIISSKASLQTTYDRRLVDTKLSVKPVKKRARAFLKDAQQSDANSVVICAHQPQMRFLLEGLTGKQVSGKNPAVQTGVLTIVQGNSVTSIDFNSPYPVIL